MTRLWVIVIFVATHPFQGCESLQWTQEVEDGAQLTRCVGQEATFPWRYSLEEGDEVVGVSYYRQYDGEGETNVANMFLEQFAPVDNIKDRISQVEKAGIKLSSLMTTDSASYKISVRLSGGGVQSQTVNLLVADEPKTISGSLEVMASKTGSNESHDLGSTNQHQHLKCGQFVSLGSPPVSVVWEDPDGDILPSTDYQNGFFILDLSERRKGGTYYCLLNLSSTAVGCLPEESELRDKAQVGVVKPQASTASAGLDGGTIAGIIIGVLVILVIAVIALVIFMRFRRGKSYAPKEPESPGPDKEAQEPLKA